MAIACHKLANVRLLTKCGGHREIRFLCKLIDNLALIRVIPCVLHVNVKFSTMCSGYCKIRIGVK